MIDLNSNEIFKFLGKVMLIFIIASNKLSELEFWLITHGYYPVINS